MDKLVQAEIDAREKTLCICGAVKSVGSLVCHWCFSYAKEYTPYRDYVGSYFHWVKYRVLPVINKKAVS